MAAIDLRYILLCVVDTTPFRSIVFLTPAIDVRVLGSFQTLVSKLLRKKDNKTTDVVRKTTKLAREYVDKMAKSAGSNESPTLKFCSS